jgi:hypothetical protein
MRRTAVDFGKLPVSAAHYDQDCRGLWQGKPLYFNANRCSRLWKMTAADLEEVSQVEHSIHEIREQCTKTLQALPAKAFAVPPIRAIREAGRRFHTDQNEEFRFFDRGEYHERGEHRRRGSPGFFTALGAYRATVGQQVALLAGHYDIDIEGDLASVLPSLDDASS